jgi:parallel beta-helix repeat protein
MGVGWGLRHPSHIFMLMGVPKGHESLLSHYTHEIDESNTVNGKPVYYWKGVEGGRVLDGAGQVILVDCNDVVVENQNLSDATTGVEVAFSSKITIRNNDCSENIYGIYLDNSNNGAISNNDCSFCPVGIYLIYSDNNSISENNCSSNHWGSGIYLHSSNNNRIYLNNFINDGDGAHSSMSTNIWNSTSKMTYAHNGSTYSNYLGNYWGDYKEKYPEAEEIDGCGIWNTPYSINSDSDYYPLTGHFENYTMEEPPAFTTVDAVIALEIAVGSSPFDSRMDVNDDRRVTSLDALMILRAAAGAITR